jgi:predicted Zn-dependent protease with MMP-like domain
MPITGDQRRSFDDLLDEVIAQLPEHLHVLLEEVPLIVEDEPGSTLLREMDIDRRDTELCGLHWGVALTQRSVEQPVGMPDRMMLFRGPILRITGRRRGRPDAPALREQIRITLLHEMGHHFGLDEDDLAELGYG